MVDAERLPELLEQHRDALHGVFQADLDPRADPEVFGEEVEKLLACRHHKETWVTVAALLRWADATASGDLRPAAGHAVTNYQQVAVQLSTVLATDPD